MTLDKLIGKLTGRGKYAIGDVRFVVEQLGLFPSPLKALKEYVANSLDEAASSPLQLNISVLVDRAERTIYITDNGEGIPRESLVYLTEKIGSSGKREFRGIKRLIGNKGFGLQGFRTFGNSCTIASHHISESDYNVLRMESGNDPRYGLKIPPEIIPGPEFNYGTRIILSDIDEKVFRQHFSVPNLRKEMGRIFEPRLRRDASKLSVTVGTFEEGKITSLLQPVTLPDYSSCLALSEVNCELTERPRKFPLFFEQDGRMKLHAGEIQVRCEVQLYADPEGKSPKVRLHHEDVEVCNLAALEGLAEHPYKSPHLTGYINVNFFDLTVTRDGLVDDKKGSKKHYFKKEILHPLEEPLKTRLEEIMAERSSQQDSSRVHNLINDAKEAMAAAYDAAGWAPPGGYKPQGGRGDKRTDDGPGKNGTDKDKKEGEETSPPDEGSEREKKGPASPRIPFGINVIPFSPSERDLPHKYDSQLKAIYINEEHALFRTEVKQSDDHLRAKRYLGQQLALALAQADMVQWANRSGENVADYLNHIGGRASKLLTYYEKFVTAKVK